METGCAPISGMSRASRQGNSGQAWNTFSPQQNSRARVGLLYTSFWLSIPPRKQPALFNASLHSLDTFGLEGETLRC